MNQHNMGKSMSQLRPNTLRLGNPTGAADYDIKYEHEFKYPKYG